MTLTNTWGYRAAIASTVSVAAAAAFTIGTTGVATAAPLESGAGETVTVTDAELGELNITGTAASDAQARTSSPDIAAAEQFSIASTQNENKFSQVITIDSPQAPSDYRFDLSLPEGISLTAAPDGGAFMLDEAGEVHGRIKAPWAHDAAGETVPTSFSVEGSSTLIQNVDLSANPQFPVTADPDGVWGWTKCIAAVTAAIAVPAGATLKLARFISKIGNVKEALQLLFGSTSNAEKLQGALAAAGTTAAELLGIAAIQNNC